MSAAAAERRLPEIDRLRGVVMILMALDHMRDFFDADSMRFRATDLTHTYPLLFFTRIVTHFCAPTFALLAGVGAFLYGARINDPPALSRFLASRGIWLILIDAFVVGPLWSMGSGIELGTLWAIGCGLLVLAGLARLSSQTALIFGGIIILAHNLLDGVHAADLGALGPWWRLLHEPGVLPAGIPGTVAYPALPWVGVVALGYGIGPIFQRSSDQQDKAIYLGGVIALAAFVVLRFFNIYGDPHPWTTQRDALFTLMSFLNVTKYPPSLLYLLITLGGAGLVLPLLRPMRGRLADALTLFGRTPLFFYVLHLYLGLAGAFALAFLRGYRPEDFAGFVENGPPAGFGAGLGGAYVAWIVVVIALYPLCRWFAGLKERRTDWWWLRYL